MIEMIVLNLSYKPLGLTSVKFLNCLREDGSNAQRGEIVTPHLGDFEKINGDWI